MLKHTITGSGVIPADLRILESYKVSKKDFKKELKQIKAFHPKSEVWNRGICGMCLEWSTHNALYAMHIKRSSTEDVDLNYPQSFFERVGYAIFGCIVWPFIK